jgi:hypothetical protein
MKRRVVTLAAAALLAVSPMFAPANAEDANYSFIGAQSQDQYLAKDQLIGAKVHGPDGKIIGDVEDLIINEYNQVIGVVMGTGGFLGLAEKKVGLRLGALKFDETDGKTVVSLPEATAANLADAPAFERVRPKKSLLERAQEKARELSDKTTATTKDAVEAAKPKIEEAKEKAKEAIERAKEAAQPAIEKAKEAAEDAKQAVEEAVEAAKEAAKEVAPPAPETPAPAEPAPAPEAAPAPAPEAPATEAAPAPQE